jgi:uncharacterized membrane protein
VSVDTPGRADQALMMAGSSERPVVSGRAGRLTGIDAARGVAMLLVCVSHVRVHFVDSAPTLYFALTSITRLATPTFLLLSGFIAAYVLATGRQNVRIAIFDRGLFVLVVGHFLLNLSDLRHVEAAQWIVGRVTVTDAIGICLMSAVLLHKMRAGVLAALGATLALVSWPIAMTLHVEAPLARHLGAALFDLRSEASALIDAAIVPYLGVFLIGMALSKSCLHDLRSASFALVARKLALYGAAAISVVCLGVLGWLSLRAAGLTPLDPDASDFAKRALDPRSKLPPGPAYLLFYGGGGLLLAAVCLYARPQRIVQPIVNWVATLGRASLMCFIVQDWLIVLAPMVFQFEGITSIAFWLTYLLGAVLVLHWLAARWDAIGANRFLTFGLKHLALAHSPHGTIRKSLG